MKPFIYKSLILFLVAVFAVTGVGPVPVAEAGSLPITAQSALLWDAQSGQVFFSKTPHQKRAPASTTKILTAITVIENADLNQVVTIPGFVESVQPSKAYLKPGEKYYLRDLLKATLISSSNDAAEVVAHVAGGGSRYRFGQMMNRTARRIGAKNSNFVRPSGLPAENQYSTAYDMAKIMQHAMDYPLIAKTLAIKNSSITSLNGRKIYLRNHNKWLWRDKREVIGKTGYTRKARYCFVGHINIGGRKILVSMFGSNQLWTDLKKLVDYQFGLSNSTMYVNRRILSKQEVVTVQKALRRAGLNPGPADGIFGSKTLTAVKQFQQSQGIDVDGIVGSQTMSRLRQFL